MCNPAQFYWQFSNRYGRFSGYLDAVDVQDAVSRVMAQSIAFSGLLFGQEYEVPVDVIDDIPGNGASQIFETASNGYALSVKRLS
jgi:hypothetical protein